MALASGLLNPEVKHAYGLAHGRVRQRAHLFVLCSSKMLFYSSIRVEGGKGGRMGKSVEEGGGNSKSRRSFGEGYLEFPPRVHIPVELES